MAGNITSEKIDLLIYGPIRPILETGFSDQYVLHTAESRGDLERLSPDTAAKLRGMAVVCADNDWQTAGRTGINTGVQKGRSAAEALRCGVAYPDGIARAWNVHGCCGQPSSEGIDDEIPAKIEGGTASAVVKALLSAFPATLCDCFLRSSAFSASQLRFTSADVSAFVSPNTCG